MSLFIELKRRNVFKVGIAYVVASWLLLQLTEVLTELLEISTDVGKIVIVLLIVGFIPALIFAWAFEMTPEGIKREHEVDRSQSITQQTGRKLDFMIIGILAVGISYLLLDKFVLDPARDAESVEAVAQAEKEAPADEETAKSIAVLPFVNMSDDAGNEYFSDGISEEILNALARVQELKVAGRTSSFAFKGKELDLREIGEALGVENILEGSVRKSGNKVRITAQLIQVDDGFHLWSDTYDRELTDVFTIQDEIASAILGQLKAALLDQEVETLASIRTDSQVYDSFLLARQRVYDRNRRSLESAVELLDAALEIDPNYAPGWALRGIANLLLREDQYGDVPNEISDELGKNDIEKALSIDADLAEAWAAMGLYHVGRVSEHNEAIEVLEKALSINPNMIDASNWLQISYGNAGQNEKVLPLLEEMIERDPLYRPGLGNLVFEYNRFGRQEQSFAVLNHARSFLGDEPQITAFEANTWASQGQYTRAVPLFEKAVEQYPDDGIFRLSYAFSLWALHDWEKMLEYGAPFQRVVALEVLGRREEATLLSLEEAAEGNIGQLLYLYVRNGRHEDLVRFIEERWDDLETFEAEYPRGSFGHGVMYPIAYAYARTGNQERFQDAMARILAAHEAHRVEGVDNDLFSFNEAIYFTMAGDNEAALQHLDRAIEQGFIGALRISSMAPMLEPLEGNPRFEAIQARMIENLNAQRAELGLEPATI